MPLFTMTTTNNHKSISASTNQITPFEGINSDQKK